MSLGISEALNPTEEAEHDVLLSVGTVHTSVVCDSEILDEMSDAFSYAVEDADYIRENKIKFYTDKGRPKDAERWAKWNGKFSVFFKTKFGTGILEDVIMWCQDQGYNVEVVDHREVPSTEDQVAIEFNENKKELYDHQENAMYQLRQNNFRGILHASVAFGKTVVGTHIINDLNLTTIVIVDRVAIMDRWVDEFDEVFAMTKEKLKGASAYVYYDKEMNPAILLCTSRLIDSAHSSKSKSMAQRNELIKWFCRDADVLIYDEVHHASARNTRKALMKIKAYFRMGLSGTVNMREDNSDYEYLASIGQVVYYYSASDLIASDKGVEVLIEPVNVTYDPDEITTYRVTSDYNEVYQEYIVHNRPRNLEICRIILEELEKDSKILVLTDRVAHGQIIQSMMSDDLVTTTDASDSERDEKFDKFKSGEIPCMVCTYSLAGEGFDLADLNVIILVGGRAEIKIRQAIGRIMRSYEGKNQAVVYDFADIVNPFKDHFIERLQIYTSEEGFVINEEGIPKWARMYL